MRRIITFLLAVIMLFGISYADMIYENTQSKVITRGVTHTYTERLTEKGWQKINILKADLTDSNVDVAVLYSNKGISYRSTVSSIAKENDVVAAINADFFDMTTPVGRTTPLGLTVTDGKVISSPSHDTMLAALAEIDGKWLTDYFTMQLYLCADNENRAEILHINKFHSTASIVMFTKDWGSTTPPANGACEMTLIDGLVTDMTENTGNTVIPENGCILRVDPKINNFFAENFKIGDNAKISLQILPENNINNSVGGGSVLCKNGEVFKFTNVIGGNNPRTAAGVSKDGKTLYLVTVEGRESNTPGMSQTELAEYMLSIGAYSAINFDGGGSTEMVAKDADGKIQIINTPSEGSERPISTALGIKSVGDDGQFSSLSLTLSKDMVFLGDYVEVWATPYDNYDNPINIEENLTYSSNDGYFVNNKYFPATVGKHEITLKCGNVTGKTTVTVSDDIGTLVTYPSSFIGTYAKINVIGIDKNGFRSIISPESVTFDITGDGSISNGEINCKDVVTVTASFKGKTAYCRGNEVEFQHNKYTFDNKQPTLLVYPDGVIGNVSDETSIVKSGKSVGLSYDFNTPLIKDTKAVYLNFNKDISLAGAEYISMWVYGDNSGQWLRIQLDGNNGEVCRETLIQSINFEGWKYIEFKIPQNNMKFLSRIYVVENEDSKKTSGKIYIDDLTVLSYTNTVYNPIILDFMSGKILSPTFIVMPQKPDKNCFLNIATGRLLEKSAKRYGKVYSMSSYENANNMQNSLAIYENGSAFLYISNTTPYKKYRELLNINTKGLSNLFIFADTSNIGDETEKRLFDTTMQNLYEKGINLFVITEGKENSSDIINGVRYLTIKNKPEINLYDYEKSMDDVKMLLFHIEGDKVIYEFRKAI